MTQVDTIHTKNRVRLTCYNSRTHFFNNSATSVIRLLVHHYGPQFGLEFKDDQFTCHRQAACIATYICEPYVVSDHALRSMSYTTAAVINRESKVLLNHDSKNPYGRCDRQ